MLCLLSYYQNSGEEQDKEAAQYIYYRDIVLRNSWERKSSSLREKFNGAMIGNHTISSDIKRALTGHGFIISGLGLMLVIMLSSVDSIAEAARSAVPLPNGYHAQIIFNALSSDGFTLALPILCALPYTTAFVDDIKSGYIKLHLHRSGVRSYIQGKLIACALSGGFAMLLGILVAYGVCFLSFTPLEVALGKDEIAQPYFAQLLLKAATLLLSGAFWSLVGFTFSAGTQSKYMAYASPFILYYVLIILHERYFEDLYVLYPKEWLFPSDSWALGSFGVIILLAEFIGITGLVFSVIAKRRLAHV